MKPNLRLPRGDKQLHVMALALTVYFLTALSAPTTGWAGGKVYFESDCLLVFNAAEKSAKVLRDGYDNETKVEEDRIQVTMDRTIVVEKRDGEIVDSYIQIQNCRLITGDSE